MSLNFEQASAAALSLGPTLESEIWEALRKVPTDNTLGDDYEDIADRTRVLRRRLIAAVLDAVFKSRRMQSSKELPDGGAEITRELAAARRDFLHDSELLDQGRDAKLSLAPVSPESIRRKVVLSADRKLFLTWLATIYLWKKGEGKFDTQRELLAWAAKKTRPNASSIKTELSNLRAALNPSEVGKRKTGFRTVDLDYVNRLVDMANSKAQRANGTPFEVLLLRAYSSSRNQLTKPGSAGQNG